jgi:hypothetical protein
MRPRGRDDEQLEGRKSAVSFAEEDDSFDEEWLERRQERQPLIGRRASILTV